MSLEASRCFTAMSPAEFERVLIPSNATAMPQQNKVLCKR